MEIRFGSGLVDKFKSTETGDILYYTKTEVNYKKYIESQGGLFIKEDFGKERAFLESLKVGDIFIDFRVSDLGEEKPGHYDFKDFINSKFTKIKIKAISEILSTEKQIKAKAYKHGKVDTTGYIKGFIGKSREITFDKVKYSQDKNGYIRDLLGNKYFKDIYISESKSKVSTKISSKDRNKTIIHDFILNYNSYINETDCNEKLIHIEEFVKKFDINKIKNLSLEEYSIGNGKKDTFCYMIERDRNIVELGSIRGGSANKFGVYWSESNSKYKYTKKFNDENDALLKIRESLLRIMQSKNIKDISSINAISPIVKTKIYYLYHSDSIIPIYSIDKLKEIVDNLGIYTYEVFDYYECQDYLLQLFNDISNPRKNTLNFMYFLYKANGDLEDDDLDKNSEDDTLKEGFLDHFKELNIQNKAQKDIFIHKSFNHQDYWSKNVTPKTDLKAILEQTREKNKYSFDDLDTLNIMTSLKVKPFIILTGMSGVGKSLRVKQLAKALYNTSPDDKTYEDFYRHIAVKPNWTDNSALFGYYNPLTEEYINGEINDIVNSAFLDPKKPFFVLLDEINLARVEYYMSDILSHMEDFDENGFSGFIKLYEIKENERIDEKINFIKNNNYLIRRKNNNPNILEVGYILSKNVFFVGTANVDETTHGFSNKVLDRCNVIEIENDYGKEIDNNKNNGIIEYKDEFYFYEKQVPTTKEKRDISGLLKKFDEKNILLSHRIAENIENYINEFPVNSANIYIGLDFSIKQRLLPKLKGDRDELNDKIQKLTDGLNKIKLVPKTLEKFKKMVGDGDDDVDYVTFW